MFYKSPTHPLLHVRDEGKAVEGRIGRAFGTGAVFAKDFVPLQVGPVQDRFGQRPVNIDSVVGSD